MGHGPVSAYDLALVPVGKNPMSQATVTTASAPVDSDSDSRAWVEPVARFGYASKGIVYCVIGVLAFRFAIGGGGGTNGPKGALQEIASQPFGQILLLIIALGLASYSVWRLIEAWVDPQNRGTDAKGLAVRIGYTISGLIYGFLAFEAAWMLISGRREGENANAAAAWTRTLMEQPFGRYLVGAVAIGLLATAFFQLKKAWKADFTKMLKTEEMSSSEGIWSERIGRMGFAARGVVYIIIGGALLTAAIQIKPSEAVGIGEALNKLSEQPYGPWLLGAVALGLTAYGVFSAAVLARYRRILVS